MSLKTSVQNGLDNFFHFAFRSNPTTKNFQFKNRAKNSDKLLLILAGYKEHLWNDVFERIQKFTPEDFDVCIISSGVYSDRLDEIATENDWSYLSCKRNNINLTQNTAIDLFPKAKVIVKMDEDIFLTDGAIEKMVKHYNQWQKDSDYKVGVVSPLINVNGYAYLKVLKKFNAVDEYAKRFGQPRYYGRFQPIEESAEAAKFMWGAEDILPKLDEMNLEFNKDEGKYSAIPVRLSIGCFVMSRDYWNEMGMFPVHRLCSDFARDEETINQNATILSEAMIMDESTIVGHLGFGNQTKEMMQFYDDHQEYFK